MKKLLGLLLIIAVAYASCKKNTTEFTTGPVVITGTWQFVAARGGLTGGYIPIPNIYTTYTFNADSTYIFVPGQASGTFHIGRVKSIFDGQMHPYITFSGQTHNGGLIKIKNDTLTISDNHVEPFIAIYARIK
jgi:hypothetical protein